MDLTNEATRGWIYRISTCVIALLTAYGVVSADKVPLIIALVGAILNTGMAARNTTV